MILLRVTERHMDITFFYGIIRLFSSMIYILISGLCSARKRHMPSFTSLKYYALSMGIWDFFLGLYYMTPTVAPAPILLSIVYAAIPFSSLFFFYFTYTYTFPDKVNKKLIFFMIIPVITSILSLTSNWQSLFITFDTSSIYYNPIREIIENFHAWFYVHSVYSTVLAFAGMIILVIKLKNPQLQNRWQCVLVIVATLLFLTSNYITTFFKPERIIWVSPTCKTAVVLVIYLTLYTDEAERIRFYGQTNIIETFAFPVFFLNFKGRIIYANKKGKKVCPFTKKLARQPYYEKELLDNFIEYPLENSLKLTNSSKGSVGAILQDKKTGEVYFLQTEKITEGKNKHKPGKMILLLTFSSLETIFNNLEDKAFKDSLCDVYNRHFLKLKEIELTQKRVLPIAFLMCDIDHLKFVNDTYGHDVGDEYIRLCADVLKNAVRNTDYVFRIGGDEFLIIIANATMGIAKKVAETIHDSVEKYAEEKIYKPGISVGCAVATSLPVDFDAIIKKADEAMYAKKHN